MTRPIAFHPLLAAVVPLLLLLSANVDEAPPSTALRAVGVAVLSVTFSDAALTILKAAA